MRVGMWCGLVPAAAGAERLAGVQGSAEELFYRIGFYLLLTVLVGWITWMLTRRRYERRLLGLMQRLAFFRALCDGASEVLLLLDGARRILEAGGTVPAVFGRIAGSLRGRDFGEMVSPDDRPRLMEALRRVREGAHQPLEVTVADAPAGRLHLDLSPAEVEGRIYFVVRCRPVSEPTASPAPPVAERAQVISFLSQVGHELRTQLTGIIGYADVLEHELAGPHREAVRLIGRSGQRLLRMVNEMLTLGRLEAGRMVFEPQAFDVAAEVVEEVQLLLHLAEAKGLGLHVRRPVLPVMATLDRAAFRRILENLLSNAIKYTREGYVAVGLEVKEDRLYLSVRDTGIGISPEFLPHVFDEFARQTAGDSGEEGTGLGLAITRRLVELMDGRIEVTSRPGEGTEFLVELPLHLRVPQAPPVSG
ncbi:MAG: hypothetical protein KatS3mg043_0235 [Rhodothermaceae bacterium]|nr:MAG: hypothetical protein KatS3mg043_0235 [Rhodothermaceae bacterium]